MKTHMVKWGNSLAVRIPKPVVEEAKLKEGDALEIEAAAEGRVELRRATQDSHARATRFPDHSRKPLRGDLNRRGRREGSCRMVTR